MLLCDAFSSPGILKLFNNPIRLRVQVSFIDYGYTLYVDRSALRRVQEIPIALWNSPPFAFEARLCRIAPSIMRNRNNIWSEEATADFRRATHGVLLEGEVRDESNVRGVLELGLVCPR